jgi:hypothetical protein
MININFVLQDDSEIFSIYDISFNPFKVGDISILTVRNFNNSEREKSNSYITEQQNKLNSTFHNKEVELISEKKYIAFNFFGVKKINIDYECKII